MLTIQVIKRPPPKPALLACTRDDGTRTIAELTVGAEHDLAHYAVETTLELRDSFYSLIARGMDIQSFDVPGATTRLDIPGEAAFTEFLVGLIQIERRNDRPYTPDEFRAELVRTIEGARRPIPEPERPALPTDAQLERIRATLDDLLARYLALPANEALTLRFPPEAS